MPTGYPKKPRIPKEPTRKRRDSKSVLAFESGGDAVAGTQDPNQPLNEMQRRFVNALVHEQMPKTAAARIAGYSQPATAAHTMMKNPKILKVIAEERAQYAKDSGMTRQKVIEGFVESINMARIKADPLTMITGFREIGRMCGFYEPTKTKVEVSVEGKVLLDRLSAMSDADLIKLAESQGDEEAIDGDFTVVEDAESEETGE